jgi:hypothetical protein
VRYLSVEMIDKDKDGIYNLEMNLLDKDSDLKESDIDLNALGQAIDTTFGRSSTPKTHTFSVKMQLGQGPTIRVHYRTIVNFINSREYINLKRLHENESQDVIAQVLKKVKADYKELTGNSLTLTERSTSDEIEMLSLNQYNPKRTAYYIRHAIYLVE